MKRGSSNCEESGETASGVFMPKSRGKRGYCREGRYVSPVLRWGRDRDDLAAVNRGVCVGRGAVISNKRERLRVRGCISLRLPSTKSDVADGLKQSAASTTAERRIDDD